MAKTFSTLSAMSGRTQMSGLGHSGGAPVTSGLPPINGHPQSRSACLKGAMKRHAPFEIEDASNRCSKEKPPGASPIQIHDCQRREVTNRLGDPGKSLA